MCHSDVSENLIELNSIEVLKCGEEVNTKIKKKYNKAKAKWNSQIQSRACNKLLNVSHVNAAL